MKKIFIIAEAGVNHNGDMEIARRLIDAASDSGAEDHLSGKGACVQNRSEGQVSARDNGCIGNPV